MAKEPLKTCSPPPAIRETQTKTSVRSHFTAPSAQTPGALGGVTVGAPGQGLLGGDPCRGPVASTSTWSCRAAQKLVPEREVLLKSQKVGKNPNSLNQGMDRLAEVRNELLIRATARMNLENTTVSEGSQSQKTPCVRFHL